MARKLPPHAAPPDDLDAAGIEATLARLSDAWTLIVDRRIGGDAGPHVAWVLLHPEIGIALLDLGRAELEPAMTAVGTLIESSDADRDALAGVPIVALPLASDDGDRIVQQLADAFADAAPCRSSDEDWVGRVIGLLLTAEDAAMAPLRAPVAEPAARPEPKVAARPSQRDWEPPPFEAHAEPLLREPSLPPRIDSDIDPDEAIAPRLESRSTRHLPWAAAIAFVAVALFAATYLMTRGPVIETASSVAVPMPVGAPTPSPTLHAALPPTAAPRTEPKPTVPKEVASLPPATVAAPITAAPQTSAPPARIAPPKRVATAAPPLAPVNPAKPGHATSAPAPVAANAAAPVVAKAPAHARPHKLATAHPVKPQTAATASLVRKQRPRETVVRRPMPIVAARPTPPRHVPAPLRDAQFGPAPRDFPSVPPPSVPPTSAKAETPAAAPSSGPPIDAGDLPPLPGSPALQQQASNQPPSAAVNAGEYRPAALPYAGAPTAGPPVMLVPQVGPPAAMPPPPSNGPTGGAFVGNP